ncbi:hypothetical protein HZC53_00470 [Candidatus Uhrbacteria bacterium]|nr:hypothetical protein [Candidatus Uhrbacteria bacterium]
MKRHPVHQLETALVRWEDTLMLGNLKRALEIYPDKYEPKHNLLRSYAGFRQYLRSYRGGPFDFKRFFDDGGMFGVDGNHLLDAYFAPLLASWMGKSRRVFSLDRDLTNLLLQTSLDGVTWGEIKWPFETLVLTFEDSPLISADGKCYYDCVLVGVVDYPAPIGKQLQAYLFSETAYLRVFFSDVERRKYKELWARGDIPNCQRKAAVAIESVMQRTDPALESTVFSTPFELIKGLPIQEMPEGWISYDGDNQIEITLTNRLVAGLCLYLNSLPSGAPQISPVRGLSRSQRHQDAKAVTNDAEICTVSSIYRLTPEEHKLLEEHKRSKHGTFELCAHFRRGHWRRPPGKGDDPTADWSVWVRPHMVRRDRLAPGELPGGTQTIVG